MKKLVLFSLLAMVPNFANASDLSLPGEKWLATFDNYICAAFGPAAARPEALEQINFKFEQLTTDSTLDNALVKATFEENGKTCRYNVILLADNAAATYQIVQSIAYDPAATNGSSYVACNAGKKVIDTALVGNKYLYFGHPHNLAFVMPGVGGEALCGGNAIAANFIVKGKVAAPAPAAN